MPFSGIVDHLKELGHKHGQRCPVYALTLGIVTDADDTGSFRIVHLKGKIISGERPV